PAKAVSLPMPAITNTPGLEEIVVTGKDFSLHVSRKNGMLTSWRFKGTELISKPLRPHFWRAATDNDRGRNMDRTQGVWRHANEDIEVESVLFADLPRSRGVAIKVTSKLPRVDAVWETVYTIYGSGDVVVDADFKPAKAELPKLPRLGMQLALPQGFER